MNRIASLIAVLSLLLAQQVHAETAVTSRPTATTSGTSVNKTAKQSSGQAGQMMIMNAATAAALIAAAQAAPPPARPPLYIMAAATVAQGLLMGGGKNNANGIANVTDGGFSGGGFDPFLPGSGTDPTTSTSSGFDAGASGAYSALTDLQGQLAEAGFTMSPDGSSMTLPDGRTVSTAALASGGVPGYEIPDSARDQAAKIAEDAAAKAASGNKVVAVGLQDGGGGGGGQPLAAVDDGSGGSRFDMSKYLKSLNNRDPSSVNGLSKRLGDDNIGIKSDNIFEMVSRQYKRKQSQSAFIK